MTCGQVVLIRKNENEVPRLGKRTFNTLNSVQVVIVKPTGTMKPTELVKPLRRKKTICQNLSLNKNEVR
jgi:hypothetical protein